MKKIVYLSMMLLGMTLVSCSSDNDELQDGPTPWEWQRQQDSILISQGYYKEGPFIGRFNVVFTDDEKKVGECEMNTYQGIHLSIPSDFFIPKMMPAGSTYTLEEGQCWGGQEFGYPMKENNGNIYWFKMVAPDYNIIMERFLCVTGTYGEYGAYFVAEYEPSDATYTRLEDKWEGEIKLNTLHVLNSLGQTMLEVKLQTPYVLHFHSTGRVKDN